MFTYPWFCDWSVVTGIAVKAVLSNGPKPQGPPNMDFDNISPISAAFCNFACLILIES